MGYMLFNERMLESYLHAKKWLKPDGELFLTSFQPNKIRIIQWKCYARKKLNLIPTYPFWWVEQVIFEMSICFSDGVYIVTLCSFLSQVKCSRRREISTSHPSPTKHYTWSSSPKPTSGAKPAFLIIVFHCYKTLLEQCPRSRQNCRGWIANVTPPQPIKPWSLTSLRARPCLKEKGEVFCVVVTWGAMCSCAGVCVWIFLRTPTSKLYSRALKCSHRANPFVRLLQVSTVIPRNRPGWAPTSRSQGILQTTHCGALSLLGKKDSKTWEVGQKGQAIRLWVILRRELGPNLVEAQTMSHAKPRWWLFLLVKKSTRHCPFPAHRHGMARLCLAWVWCSKLMHRMSTPRTKATLCAPLSPSNYGRTVKAIRLRVGRTVFCIALEIPAPVSSARSEGNLPFRFCAQDMCPEQAGPHSPSPVPCLVRAVKAMTINLFVFVHRTRSTCASAWRGRWSTRWTSARRRRRTCTTSRSPSPSPSCSPVPCTASPSGSTSPSSDKSTCCEKYFLQRENSAKRQKIHSIGTRGLFPVCALKWVLLIRFLWQLDRRCFSICIKDFKN